MNQVFPQHVREILSRAEVECGAYGRHVGLQDLRELSVEEFGAILWALPLREYPNLSREFPKAPSADTQLLWTGASGQRIVDETCAFIRTIVGARYAGEVRPYRENVLDFGCGYGRMLRFLQYYYDPANVFGCDPWDESLKRCAYDRVSGTVELSDWIPQDLPFKDETFHVIYAFSVFTHLPKEVATTCLRTLRRKIRNDGVLAITIRSGSFWNAMTHLGDHQHRDLAKQHDADGYAFLPQADAVPIDGIVTYGDTSMSVEYLAGLAPDWTVKGTIWNAVDPQQTVVFLSPR